MRKGDDPVLEATSNFRYMARHAATPTARAYWHRRVDAILNPPKLQRAREIRKAVGKRSAVTVDSATFRSTPDAP